jgi:hypothetical protein
MDSIAQCILAAGGFIFLLCAGVALINHIDNPKGK